MPSVNTKMAQLLAARRARGTHPENRRLRAKNILRLAEVIQATIKDRGSK